MSKRKTVWETEHSDQFRKIRRLRGSKNFISERERSLYSMRSLTFDQRQCYFLKFDDNKFTKCCGNIKNFIPEKLRKNFQTRSGKKTF